MSTGQAIAIAVGFVGAVFALGMGGGMIADWFRAKVSTARRPTAEKAGSDAGAMPKASDRPADGFNGDTPHLIRSINALLDLDASGALTHRIGGHARTLLHAAAVRLADKERAQ